MGAYPRMMDICHHHHIHFDDEVIRLLEKLNRKTNKIMATFEELNTAMGTISSELDKVSADTDNLLSQLSNIPTGGMTTEQQQALDDATGKAQDIVNRLQALDDKVPEVQTQS